jgi:hypothetical protein
MKLLEYGFAHPHDEGWTTDRSGGEIGVRWSGKTKITDIKNSIKILFGS